MGTDRGRCTAISRTERGLRFGTTSVSSLPLIVSFSSSTADERVESDAVVAEKLRRPLLGFGEQPAHLLVDRQLSSLGERPRRPGLADRVLRLRPTRTRSDRGAGKDPSREPSLSRARWRLARSLAAPVEASPITSISDALPPRRIARESLR